jgi:long-chain acyl-CoA synthetase
VCSTEFNGCKTILEALQKTVKEKGDRPFLGTRDSEAEGRPYKWKTFSEINDLVDAFARGIQALNLAPDTVGEEGKNWNFLGIFSKNREEWTVADLACMRSSVTIVPFYDSLGKEALALVINLTNLTTMCIERCSFQTLLKLKTEAHCPTLANLVLFEKDITEEERAQATAGGLKVFTFSDVLEAGRQNPTITFTEPTPDTIYMLCFTSGTTGDAKGAKETHSAFLANMYFFENANFNLTQDDVVISYLPYAHVYEQCFLLAAACHGFSLGFYSGDALKLMEDVVVLKPTVFPAVPRLLNRIHSKILEGIAAQPEPVQQYFAKAMKEK